ncbi:MAG: hypothetical protein WAP52_03825 [Candidatus Sungiibacteriota bacterium]
MGKKDTQKQEENIATKFGEFLCIFEANDPDPGFTVTVPAAPGFIAGGRTMSEAKRLARKGLEFHCECILLERGGATKRSRAFALSA